MLMLSQFNKANELCRERSELSMTLAELASADVITIGVDGGYGSIDVSVDDAGPTVELARMAALARIAEIDHELTAIGVAIDLPATVPLRDDDFETDEEADGDRLVSRAA